MSGKNEVDKTEFYLVGLETYESFDQVISEMHKLKLCLLDKLDGIYSRTALIEADEKQFKIIYHEDVGVYAFSIDEENDDWLQKILINVVTHLNE
jgi:hypothetical protein